MINCIRYPTKHKRVIKQSKGFCGRAKNCYRIAIRRLEKSWQYAYRNQKVKRREFGKLWIQRLNAGVRQHDVSYSNFINTQSKSVLVLDRKILSGLAMYEPFSYKAVVDVVKMTAAAGVGK
jgi:large subunit ribosomal protein L20